MTLPNIYTWDLDDPTAAPPFILPAPEAVIGATDECVDQYFTQQDILDLFDRLLSEDYLRVIKEVGPGYELLQAVAKGDERVSIAVGRLECGSFLTTAHGGAWATVEVEFYRENAAAGAVTMKAGTIVTTSRTGRDFVTLADAIFGASDVGPITVEVEAVAQGFEWNVPGQVITKASEVLPGEIDTIKLPLQEDGAGVADIVDPTVRVRQILDADGGAAPMLDALGRDRGIDRSSGEPDSAYRYRLRTLPDVVSRDAIVRQVTRYLAGVGFVFDPANFIETWEPRYQTCWDAEVGIPTTHGYDPNCFVYDDPRDPTPFRNRWLDEEEYRGTFIVVVPNFPAMRDVGMAYDDDAADADDLLTDMGQRAVSAYDVPFDYALSLQGGYDGFDLPKQTAYKGLFDLLQKIKAGGIVAVVELAGQ